jgi:hypothetical protein
LNLQLCNDNVILNLHLKTNLVMMVFLAWGKLFKKLSAIVHINWSHILFHYVDIFWPLCWFCKCFGITPKCVLIYFGCRNSSLGLTSKTRVCKGSSQEWSPRVRFHVLENVGECEGMKPHIPKWIPILGIRVPMDFQIFRGRLQGTKIIGLKSYLYHWKVLAT